jgi:hypothetical protein
MPRPGDVVGVYPTGDMREVGRQRLEATKQRFKERYVQATEAHEHLWIATVGFYVTVPPPPDVLFDADSLAVPPVVGCFVCEQEYAEVTSSACPGEPR